MMVIKIKSYSFIFFLLIFHFLILTIQFLIRKIIFMISIIFLCVDRNIIFFKFFSKFPLMLHFIMWKKIHFYHLNLIIIFIIIVNQFYFIINSMYLFSSCNLFKFQNQIKLNLLWKPLITRILSFFKFFYFLIDLMHFHSMIIFTYFKTNSFQ